MSEWRSAGTCLLARQAGATRTRATGWTAGGIEATPRLLYRAETVLRSGLPVLVFHRLRRDRGRVQAASPGSRLFYQTSSDVGSAAGSVERVWHSELHHRNGIQDECLRAIATAQGETACTASRHHRSLHALMCGVT